MISYARLTAAAALLATSALATAQSPPPPIPAEAKMQAVPYLENAGMSDVFEITSSEIALTKSQNPMIRTYATELIGHHTMTTNTALAAAKKGGVMPPPPVLNAQFRALVSELNNAPAADFDRIYIAQQIPSHQGALDLQTGYAANGDNASLKAAARASVPIVRQHLDEANKLQARMARR